MGILLMKVNIVSFIHFFEENNDQQKQWHVIIYQAEKKNWQIVQIQQSNMIIYCPNLKINSKETKHRVSHTFVVK